MTNVEKFIAALVAGLQDIEDAMLAILAQRLIDNAIGAQLDLIGRVVGQKRLGLSDADYRRYLRARISVNRSSGTMPEIIAIARLVLGDLEGSIVIRTVYNATFILEVQDRPTTDAEASALVALVSAAAKAAGVRCYVAWSAVPLSQTFRLDSGPGLDQGHLARGVDQNGVV